MAKKKTTKKDDKKVAHDEFYTEDGKKATLVTKEGLNKLVEELVNSGDKNSYWIAYRACRNLVKKEPIKVMDLLKIDEYKYKKRVYVRDDYFRN